MARNGITRTVRRTLPSLLSSVLVVSLAVPASPWLPGQSAATLELADVPGLPGGHEALLTGLDMSTIEPVPWEQSASAELVTSEPSDPLPEPEFPKPGGWSVELGGRGQVAAVVAGTAGPVEVAAEAPDVAGVQLRLEVLDHGLASRLDGSGLMFTLSGLDQWPAGARRLPAKLVIDYSEFAAAAGGDFADRLSVVAFAPCGLQAPLPDGCEEPRTSLETVNNAASEQLIVEVEDLKIGRAHV